MMRVGASIFCLFNDETNNDSSVVRFYPIHGMIRCLSYALSLQYVCMYEL